MLGRNTVAILSKRASLMRTTTTTTLHSFSYSATTAFSSSSSTSSTPTTNDISKYYRIEISNIARIDATKITVRGPDIDGILASMTVALARHGCSLKELHAGYYEQTNDNDRNNSNQSNDNAVVNETIALHKHYQGDLIEDIFFVAQHETNEQFPDDSLLEIGEGLLESLRNPMICLSGKTTTSEEEQERINLLKQSSKEGNDDVGTEEQITVIRKYTP